MKNPWIRLGRFIFTAFFVFFLGSVGSVLFYRFAPVMVTPLMVLRSVQSLWGPELVGIHKDWVPLAEIAPSMQKAVLKAEDARFFEHNGFDYEAIEKAMKYNKTHKKIKGASTISQQTAKNVFLWPNRDWIRKGMEAYFTVLIEFIWPKERIMEVYLNVIEMGPGVYGVEAASQRYFKRSAKNITAAQASLIAAVLPNPRKFRIDRPSSYVVKRQYRILYRVSPPLPAMATKDDKASLLDFFDLKFDNDDEE
ncbi:monofunctional biosynthetic peptidoglycan transglycosylase [Bdellovibrio svalbardensis]|uniref:Biosynthetic peptidoglycan transglycosylase n=1 Tax=Bdellovibrio svalbardensis TaxID=2972972 RepID=A0ABT6DNB1_9BACT|nr:monofunctional biosynthetic peptidoglycan transglycosylase [Bdellovibrio svalbardensis]MDG0818109.1 monofunctional biosynthetic peptidoglycan transglycosylase [Bdellovibrio svalbardensis]